MKPVKLTVRRIGWVVEVTDSDGYFRYEWCTLSSSRKKAIEACGLEIYEHFKEEGHVRCVKVYVQEGD